MFNKILVLLSCLVITGCDDRPSFEEAIQNYSNNKYAFNQLQKHSCKLWASKSRGVYRFDDEIPEKRRPELDKYLVIIGGSGVTYQKEASGKCTITIGYYARGFAGSGISYSYKYRVNDPKPYNLKRHTYKKIVESQKDVIFDMSLGDDWYFSFKSS